MLNYANGLINLFEKYLKLSLVIKNYKKKIGEDFKQKNKKKNWKGELFAIIYLHDMFIISKIHFFCGFNELYGYMNILC